MVLVFFSLPSLLPGVTGKMSTKSVSNKNATLKQKVIVLQIQPFPCPACYLAIHRLPVGFYFLSSCSLKGFYPSTVYMYKNISYCQTSEP